MKRMMKLEVEATDLAPYIENEVNRRVNAIWSIVTTAMKEAGERALNGAGQPKKARRKTGTHPHVSVKRLARVPPTPEAAALVDKQVHFNNGRGSYTGVVKRANGPYVIIFAKGVGLITRSAAKVKPVHTP